MLQRYRGRVGEYMWEKEQQRLERYKDRPWELQSKESAGNSLLVLLLIALAIPVGVLLFSLF